MNRLAGIIVAALGLVVAILSITKIVPHLTQTGVEMILFGGLIIGLSFIEKPDSEGTERMSTGSTLGNIFFAPSDVFRNLRRHPRWLVALLVMSILSTAYSNLFMERLGADRVANFAIDKTLEIGLIANNEEAKKGIEDGRADAIEQAINPVARSGEAVSSFARSVFGYCFLSLIFMLFMMAMGGKLHFWQAFSATIYASFPVSVIRHLLNTLLLYLKDPTDIHPILGQQNLIQDNLSFLVTSAQNPVIYTLLASFSVLMFYWLWMNATGLKNAGEKVSGTAAWSASIGIFVVMLLLGVTMAALFPSFMS